MNATSHEPQRREPPAESGTVAESPVYVPPRVETVLTAEALAREVNYAGGASIPP